MGQSYYGYICIACSCLGASNRGSFTSKGKDIFIITWSLVEILTDLIQPYGSKKALISRTMMKNILFHAFYQVS